MTVPDFLTDPARACRGVDPELFFAAYEGRLERAKEICSACPFQTPCPALRRRQRGTLRRVRRRPVLQRDRTRPRRTGRQRGRASAYRKHHCRCPQARAAELVRKKKYETSLGGGPRSHGDNFPATNITQPGVPAFYAHPRRGCANLKRPDVMFPAYTWQVPAAEAVCRRCPFKTECADWALNTAQMFGVYGGITEKERRKMIAARILAGAA